MAFKLNSQGQLPHASSGKLLNWGFKARFWHGERRRSLTWVKRYARPKPRYAIDTSGRTVIESKDQMKKRGLRSSDLAGSLAVIFFSSGVSGKTLQILQRGDLALGDMIGG